MGRYSDGMSVMHARVAEVQRLLSDGAADESFEEPLTEPRAGRPAAAPG